VNGSVAPFLARDLGLGDAQISATFAWIGLSSLGSLWLGREADRLGRRRVLLACSALLPFGALASACAPSAGAYAAAQVLVYALGGTLLATLHVLVCEEAGEGQRARQLGRVGLVCTAFSVGPLLAISLCSGAAGAWRWIWAGSALPLLALPALARALPETRRWHAAARSGETQAARTWGVFERAYRGRALRVLAAVVCVHAAEFATRTWLFYHLVRSHALPAPAAVLLLVTFGGIGLAGFAAGGRCADRFGRRATFLAAAALFGVCSLGYYGAPPGSGAPRLALLALSLAGLAAGGNAALVAFRALATELFPTRLRGTLGGWLALGSAAGWLLAMGGASLLAGALGGLGPAVAALVAAVLPAAAWLLLRLPETAGLPLGDAAPRPPAGVAEALPG
jgi:AAHS family 4-hydroxybenzoate transporter-like MFS transporter